MKKALIVLALILTFGGVASAKNKDKCYQTGSLSVTVSEDKYRTGWYDNTYCYGNFCGGDITPTIASETYYDYLLKTEDGTLYMMKETGLRGTIAGNSLPHFNNVKPGVATAVDYRIEKHGTATVWITDEQENLIQVKQDRLFVFIKTTKGEAKFELDLFSAPTK